MMFGLDKCCTRIACKKLVLHESVYVCCWVEKTVENCIDKCWCRNHPIEWKGFSFDTRALKEGGGGALCTNGDIPWCH